MKKIFSYLAATAMLFAASCSNEDLGTNNANDTQVTFNLSLEGQSGTRAIGDGAGVTKLSYYIFDVQTGERLNHYDYENQTFSTVTPKIQLAKDQRYKAVFWAQKATDAYTIEKADDKSTVNIKVNYAKNANDEARDAFYGVVEFTVTGSERIDVLLERPFAQLNVGVTKADYDAAVASGVTIKNSWAKVEDVYNTLNLLTGEATGEVDAEFTLAQRPTQDLEVNLDNSTDNAGNATIEEDEKFAYLSMNYILAGDRKNVKASFRFENEDGSKKINFNSGLDAVPVERNFRTNLVGQILTGNLDFNVKIDANFKGDHNISGIVSANDQQAVDNALKDPNVHTIMLGADEEYTIDLYKDAHSKESLTIIGTNGTKVKFADQQVRMQLFKNFRIANCEIMHMATKSWGMLVFGGGNKADGVYTVENCTFNGVGTQGIYINEDMSGATYNINNCTFDGNFGGEGAITIQTNNAQFNVNVNGCTFNNIPTTSHKIFLASYDGQGSFYYGWNLNTDLQATTAYEIDMFAKLGQPVELPTGNYNIANVLVGNNMTIKGTEDVVITVGTPNLNGGNLTLEGVTIKGSGTYTGVQHANTVTYNNAKIVGEMCLYGEKVVFNGCTFELAAGQYIWTYGAKEAEFINCTFNTNGKAILVYNEGNGANNVVVKNCKFNATAGAKAGAIANQNCAAIEIDNFQSSGVGAAHKVTTEGNTYSSNFSGEWRIKNFVAGNAVTVNNTEYTQIALDGKLMTIDANKNVTVVE